MNKDISQRAGSALLWQAGQLLTAKLLGLARFMVLARLLAPDEFGVVAIAAVVLELSLALSNVGLKTALVQKMPAEEVDYNATWTLGLARGALIAVVLAVSAPLLATAFDEPAATPFIRVLGLRPFIAALGSVKVVSLTRKLRFAPLARITVASAAMEATIAVALAPVIGAWALIVGVLAAATLGSVLSYLVAPHRPRLELSKVASAQLLRYGRWLLVTSVVGVTGQFVLRMAISRGLGVAELGVFYLGAKLALLPNDVAGEVIRTVAFPVVSRVQEDQDRIRRAFQATLSAMLGLLLPVYAVLVALAEPIVRVALGAQWDAMVIVLQIFAIDGIVDILADTAKPLMLGVGRPERRALMKGVRTVVILIVVWPLVSQFGLAGAASAFLIAETVQFLVALAVVRRTLPRPFSGLSQRASAIGFAAAVAGSTAWLAYEAIPIPIDLVGLTIAVLAGGLASLGTLFLAERRWRLGLADDLFAAFPWIRSALEGRVNI